jgi:riboflavin biosynthesis pyrimidine reductase
MTAQDTRPRDWAAHFAAVEARRTARSLAPLAAVSTVGERGAAGGLRPIGNAWTAAAFDGPFYETASDGVSLGLVFVQSRDGNTATRNPAALGGGAVDEHLIYEGLTRVAADAVIAGAATLHPDAMFTTWRPELIALRRSLGLPRHPAQVIMSADGSVAAEELLVFNVPPVPVYVLTSPRGRERLGPSLASRPWVEAIVGVSLPEQFAALGDRGLRRGCSVGGRRSATALIDAGLVQDVYLTTTSAPGGEPDTPWYVGKRALRPRCVLAKQWAGEHGVVRFEHLVLSNDGQA